jgi:hypothetical protein
MNARERRVYAQITTFRSYLDNTDRGVVEDGPVFLFSLFAAAFSFASLIARLTAKGSLSGRSFKT